MADYPLSASGIKYSLSFVCPQIVQWYSEDFGVTEQEAVETLYNSELYKELEDSETALWHLSPRLLAELLNEEITTGHITFPEEAA